MDSAMSQQVLVGAKTKNSTKAVSSSPWVPSVLRSRKRSRSNRRQRSATRPAKRRIWGEAFLRAHQDVQELRESRGIEHVGAKTKNSTKARCPSVLSIPSLSRSPSVPNVPGREMIRLQKDSVAEAQLQRLRTIMKKGDWMCRCGNHNYASRVYCHSVHCGLHWRDSNVFVQTIRS